MPRGLPGLLRLQMVVMHKPNGPVSTKGTAMKFADWSMQGVEFANCNCIWGCPCQFNGPPTHGNCRAYTFVQIDRGRFDGVPLDGLRWGILAAWPGPIHLGNGTFQSVVDRSEERRVGKECRSRW